MTNLVRSVLVVRIVPRTLTSLCGSMFSVPSFVIMLDSDDLLSILVKLTLGLRAIDVLACGIIIALFGVNGPGRDITGALWICSARPFRDIVMCETWILLFTMTAFDPRLIIMCVPSLGLMVTPLTWFISWVGPICFRSVELTVTALELRSAVMLLFRLLPTVPLTCVVAAKLVECSVT